MSNLATQLAHLKNHVSYPANRGQVVSACNNMSDVPTEDRNWFSQNLAEGTYGNAEEVMSALLKKV